MILRRKHRYLLVSASREIDAGSQANGIGAELLAFMGELPFSQANPRISAQYTPRMFVMQVNRHHERQVALALSFVKRLHGERVGLCTIKTSGSIKSLALYAKKLAA